MSNRRDLTLDDIGEFKGPEDEEESLIYTGHGDCWIKPDCPCLETCVAFNAHSLDGDQNVCLVLQQMQDLSLPNLELKEQLTEAIQTQNNTLISLLQSIQSLATRL